MTVKELTTVITRISANSTLYICGDTMQSDINATGFQKFCKVFDDEECIITQVIPEDFLG